MTPTLDSIVSRLTAKQLRLMVALSEEGSMLAAATKLGLTQPGASKALGEIEMTFGAPLFVRSHRGLQVNEVGECVVRYSRLILGELVSLQKEVSILLRNGRGTVAVGCVGRATSIVASAVSALLTSSPDIAVTVIEDGPDALLRQLQRGRIDLVVCATDIPLDLGQFQTTWLASEPLAVLVHRTHPLGEVADAVGLRDLANLRWAFCSDFADLRNRLEGEFEAQALEPPTSVLESNSLFLTLGLLEQGKDLAVLVSGDVASYCERHGLATALNLTLTTPNASFQVVRRQGSAPSRKVAALLAQLERAASQQAAAPALRRATPLPPPRGRSAPIDDRTCQVPSNRID